MHFPSLVPPDSNPSVRNVGFVCRPARARCGLVAGAGLGEFRHSRIPAPGHGLRMLRSPPEDSDILPPKPFRVYLGSTVRLNRPHGFPIASGSPTTCTNCLAHCSLVAGFTRLPGSIREAL